MSQSLEVLLKTQEGRNISEVYILKLMKKIGTKRAVIRIGHDASKYAVIGREIAELIDWFGYTKHTSYFPLTISKVNELDKLKELEIIKVYDNIPLSSVKLSAKGVYSNQRYSQGCEFANTRIIGTGDPSAQWSLNHPFTRTKNLYLPI